MQSLVFLNYFFQNLSKKNLCWCRLDPLGKGRVNQELYRTSIPCHTFFGKYPGGGALPFKIGREACPIFLGSENFVKIYIFGSSFCLCKFIFLGSH